ncbi:hypothetical protein CGLO_09168 [Colletotrichum gloeosporioides Cg-14]|uniref:Uncharacterized protein n=1 Tax=Colletotrichum gloeosporioides (strain Cg-14) TaxID=1237896 RepID=T0K753_COLGC|nr:hypothetical protein CGLO_09168 [Colletotrichum gloeosporioides Cg-14]
MKVFNFFLIPIFCVALAAPAPSQNQCIANTPNVLQYSAPDGSTVQEKGCGLAIPRDTPEATAAIAKRGWFDTLQVVWIITLSDSRDLIIRTLLSMFNTDIKLFTEVEGMGVTIDEVSQQASQVSFKLNARGTWGNASASFVYNYVNGGITTFVPGGAQDANGNNLTVNTNYCHARQ